MCCYFLNQCKTHKLESALLKSLNHTNGRGCGRGHYPLKILMFKVTERRTEEPCSFVGGRNESAEELLKCSRDDNGEQNCTRPEPKRFEATVCSSGIIQRSLCVGACACVCMDNLGGTESAGELVLTCRIKSAVT